MIAICYDLFAVPCFIITNLRLYIYMLVCLCVFPVVILNYYFL